MRRLLRLWLPPLVWMALIYLVSAQESVPSVPGLWDLLLKKGSHILAYGLLTILYLRAMRGSSIGDTPARALSAALAVTYALTDEHHQRFVPGRNGTLVDVAIDGVGIAGAILLDWWAGTRHERPEQAVSQ